MHPDTGTPHQFQVTSPRHKGTEVSQQNGGKNVFNMGKTINFSLILFRKTAEPFILGEIFQNNSA